MLTRLRHEWRSFIGYAPGTRFEQLYERKRRDGGHLAARAFWVFAGFALIAAGFVMLFTPGPGLLAIAFGAACLARESLPFARKCDRAEVRLREAIERRRKRGKPP